MNIYCFAGPNGSGKTTAASKFLENNLLNDLPFVNPDYFVEKIAQSVVGYETRNIIAAEYAERKRYELLEEEKSFIFETVLSTPRNLEFLKLAKSKGAIISTVYVLTRDKNKNIDRVAKRVKEGGHDVPEDKIKARYDRCLKLLPEVIDASDNVLLYDNSLENHTSIIFQKSDKSALVLSNNPTEDLFLNQILIKPLKEQYGYKFIYCDINQKKINIYSISDLKKFENEVLESSRHTRHNKEVDELTI